MSEQSTQNLNPFQRAALAKKQAAENQTNAHEQTAKYVRGEIDKLPDPLPETPKSPKGKSFAEIVAAKKAASKGKEDDKKRTALFGTGFTKKAVAKAEKQFEAGQAKESHVPAPLSAKAKQDKATETETAAAEETIKSLNLQFSSDKKITLDEYQQAALEGLRHEQFGCLIGAAGTGKTTVTKQLVEQIINDTETIKASQGSGKMGASMQSDGMADYHIPAIAACAYTGIATQNVKQSLGKDFPIRCDTIHGLLGFYPIESAKYDEKKGEHVKTMKFIPWYDANNKMPWKVIIIDEAGMLPLDLWHYLLDACLPDCRIIMIGDINQLPPVQGRSVLGFAMLKWPTFALEQIHRQAADSPIIANAHRILKGQFPVKDSKKFLIANMDGSALTTFAKILNIVKGMDAKGVFDPIHDAVITSVNGDTLGQQHFNQLLLPHFNAERHDENGVLMNKRYTIYGAKTQCAFAVMDKIMVLSNDRPRGITNGMTGIVTSIRPNENYQGKMSNATLANFNLSDDDLNLNEDAFLAVQDEEKEDDDETKRQASHVVTVKFTTNDKEIEFKSSGDFAKLTHAYAFTCHKAQGKEYPNVVVVCHSKNARMLCREWLYTAITRASDRVVLCANDRGLAMALRNQAVKGNTIAEKAQSFIALMDKKDTRVPALPEPKQIAVFEKEKKDAIDLELEAQSTELTET